MPLIIGTDELYLHEDELENAAEILRAQLVLFGRGEESCASGLIRVPWPLLVDPASGADGYSSVSSSPTLKGDGERNSHYHQKQQGSHHHSPSFETDPSTLGTGYGGYDELGVATYLRSSRQVASNAAVAAAAATTVPVSAAATDEKNYVSTRGDEAEAHEDNDDDGDDNVFSASAAEPIAIDSSFDDSWEAEVEGISDRGGDSFDTFGYYQAMVPRYSEEARAASAATQAAAAASHAAAATAAYAASAASVAASSADEATSGDPNESYDQAGDGGRGFFFGKSSWSGFSPGDGDGVDHVALAK